MTSWTAEWPAVVASTDGTRAIAMLALRHTKRQLNWDASFIEAQMTLRPSSESVTVLVAISGSFAATWRHPGQTLGWRTPLDKALPDLVLIELGNMLDSGDIPTDRSELPEDFVVSIDTYGVFERDPAGEKTIRAFLRGHVYWSWRYGLPHAALSRPEATRLGISTEDLVRWAYPDEGLLWEKVGESDLRALPGLVRSFQPGAQLAPNSTSQGATRFEVALSFAGEQRPFVREVANLLRGSGVSVFFDEFHQVGLWGRDLSTALGGIYGDQSRYIVIFVSREYLDKPWTEHERQHALAGRIRRMDSSVLPVLLDGSQLPGLPSSVAYLDAGSLTPADVASRVLQKLQAGSDHHV